MIEFIVSFAKAYAYCFVPPRHFDKETYTDDELEYLAYCHPFSFWF